MILSDKEIRALLTEKPKLIENFDENSLQSESYDLTIGKKISKYNSDFKIVNLDNQNEIDRAYSTFTMPEDGYLLGPNEYILISVLEKLNIPNYITAHVRPRTKFTRIGLIVSGQHCNSSYSGHLNLGLYNANPFAIKILPGMKLAQIVFEELKSIPSEKKQYRLKGKYQNETGTEGSDFSEEISGVFEKNFNNDTDAKEAYKILKKGLKKEV